MFLNLIYSKGDFMGKIYCTECGKELEDTVKFCSSCGTPINKKDIPPKSNEDENKNETSNEGINVKEISKKTNNNKLSTSTKIFIGVAGICIIAVLIVVGYVGYSIVTAPADVVSEDAPKNLSPSFTDTIYGINFKIPEGYEAFGGTDNQNKGTMTSYDRSYVGPDGNIIEISVSTTKGNFYWDLSQNRDYNDVDKTIKGHKGVLKSSGAFSYVDGDKLVVITGADKQQLKSIIRE